MVPPDAFSISSAHALVAGTSGWAGGSQIEIFRSTGLSWAIAAVPAAARPIASARASFFMAVPPKLFVTPTISAHDNSANRVYERRAMDITLASRHAALDVLVACLDKGQPLDDALVRHKGFAGLEPRDRAFVRLLLATTLRRLGEIDEILGALIERPFKAADVTARQVLRLGTAQLVFLGTPAHAAVDTSVRLVVDAGMTHLRGLADGVAREAIALLPGRYPAWLNTPHWLYQSCAAVYGETPTGATAAAQLKEAP